MSELPSRWLLKIHEAAVEAELDSQISVLRSILPSKVRAMLPTDSKSAAAQLLHDLSTLNSLASHGNAEPLAIWLQTARTLAGGFATSATLLEEALDLLLEEKASEQTTAFAPPTPVPEVKPQILNPPAGQPALRRLLLRMFTTSELKMFIGDYYQSILDTIAWNGSPATIAQQVIRSLERHGFLRPALFSQLMRERPMREKEISEVQHLFGA